MNKIIFLALILFLSVACSERKKSNVHSQFKKISVIRCAEIESDAIIYMPSDILQSDSCLIIADYYLVVP